jgi:hypothetical protein
MNCFLFGGKSVQISAKGSEILKYSLFSPVPAGRVQKSTFKQTKKIFPYSSIIIISSHLQASGFHCNAAEISVL